MNAQNETRCLSNGVIVRRFNVLTTRTWVYEALEPRTTHHTIETVEGRQYGRIGSQDLPAELDALKPMSDERYTRVHAWIESENRRSYASIHEAFPEAHNGVEHDGEVNEIV
jgi:hypothetical protein